MAKIKITCDSTCDLTPELYARHDIEVLPLQIRLGEELRTDGLDVTADELFDFAKRAMPMRAPRSLSNGEGYALAAYLLDLAKDFSGFYNRCSVKNAETPALQAARLALSKLVRDILGDGLHTLTIQTIESM